MIVMNLNNDTKITKQLEKRSTLHSNLLPQNINIDE